MLLKPTNELQDLMYVHITFIYFLANSSLASINILYILFSRNLQDDFENFQQSVVKTGEDAKANQTQVSNVVPDGTAVITPVGGPAPQADDICAICHKTKFADGIGNSCHYCGVRSCARCGRKVNLRGAKGSALVSR